MGDQIDYGMRVYDPRAGRFLSVDPLTNKYPELTPYQYASNRPVDGIDRDGLEWTLTGTVQRNLEGRVFQMHDNEVAIKQKWQAYGLLAMKREATLNPAQKPSGPYEQQLWKENSIQKFQENGYNDDGSKPFLKRLSDNKTWNSFAENIGLPLLEAAAAEGAGRLLFSGAAKAETFYRALSKTDYEAFVKTGNIPATGETFISPTKEFSADYKGVLLEINTKAGTLKQLEAIGVRNIANAHPNAAMPVVESGWTKINAFFKLETNEAGLQQVNIGLGRGKALEIFNKNIQSVKVVTR